MTNEKLNQAYYQRHHLRTGSRLIKELHKIILKPKNDINSWFANKDFRNLIFYHLKK